MNKKVFDWSRADAMTEEERHAAAMSDPDAQPSTDKQLKQFKRRPLPQIIRARLKLSQEEFSEKFRIPLGTLRDWEQRRKEPDASAQAYLTVIRHNPQAVLEALQPAA